MVSVVTLVGTMEIVTRLEVSSSIKAGTGQGNDCLSVLRTSLYLAWTIPHLGKLA